MELVDTIISFGAFLLAGISLIWQFKDSFVDLKLDVIKVYKHIGTLGPQYIFRLHFINNASSPVSVSRIVFKNGEKSVAVESSKLRLIKTSHKSSSTQIVDGERVVSEKITDRGRLYSHELPFRVDGDGCEGGEFYLLDTNNDLKLDTVDNIDVELYTNKKKVKLTVSIKQVETWDDFEVCLD